MQTTAPLLLGLGLLLGDPRGVGAALPPPPAPAPRPAAGLSAEMDLARLGELLHDRLDPRGQSQAALVLVSSSDPAAEKMVRRALRQPEDLEAFLAVTTAIRLRLDGRFLDELLAALAANRARARQAVAEALAVLPQPTLVPRLQALADDARADLTVRQTALWVLGRSGRQQAAGVLVAHLGADNEQLRQMAALALAEMTGQTYGTDAARWRAWWDRHKGMTQEQWLEMRLAFQISRATRLEGELTRARAHVLRLQQMLYARLPVAERLAHLRSLLEQEDPAVRGLAIVWALDLLATADGPRTDELTAGLLRLSHDGHSEVQRGAVHALGRVGGPEARAPVLARLKQLLKTGGPGARAAAARSLALQAKRADAAARREIVPLLQKALEDRAVEVVVEAAEALGALGAPEASPVLTNLLRHPAEHVRQTAAQALERVADVRALDGLLKGLDDGSVNVRFSLVGALGRAAGDCQILPPEQKKQMLTRLEGLLLRDPSPAVRSRAATVLGECGAPALLETLWRVVQSPGAGPVQEKAFGALVEVVVRSESLTLLRQWDRALVEAKEPARRLLLLGTAAARWQQRPETHVAAHAAQEVLVQAQLDQGKWSAAAPLARELLTRPVADEAEREKRLRWLLRAGELALRDGNRAEALRAAQEAQAHLPRTGALTDAFARLAKQAAGKN